MQQRFTPPQREQRNSPDLAQRHHADPALLQFKAELAKMNVEEQAEALRPPLPAIMCRGSIDERSTHYQDTDPEGRSNAPNEHDLTVNIRSYCDPWEDCDAPQERPVQSTVILTDSSLVEMLTNLGINATLNVTPYNATDVPGLSTDQHVWPVSEQIGELIGVVRNQSYEELCVDLGYQPQTDRRSCLESESPDCRRLSNRQLARLNRSGRYGALGVEVYASWSDNSSLPHGLIFWGEVRLSNDRIYRSNLDRLEEQEGTSYVRCVATFDVAFHSEQLILTPTGAAIVIEKPDVRLQHSADSLEALSELIGEEE